MHRDRKILVMERLDRLLVYRLERQTSRPTQLRQIAAIDLPEALDFIGTSPAWQFLSQEPALDDMDNASLILHPELYLLQNSATQAPRPWTAFLDRPKLIQQSVSLAKSQLIYSCHSSVSAHFSQYRSIVPWAEVVRMLAEKQKLPNPWLIANSQYLWITDASGKLYESAITNTEYSHWLIAQLMPDSTSRQKYQTIFDCDNTTKQVSLNQFNAQTTSINPQMKSIEAMLGLLMQEQ